MSKILKDCTINFLIICLFIAFNVVLSSFQRTSFEVFHQKDEPSKLNSKR